MADRIVKNDIRSTRGSVPPHRVSEFITADEGRSGSTARKLIDLGWRQS
jgi:hypothetical protein